MNENTPEAVKAIAALAAAGLETRDVHGTPVVILPEGYKAELLEKLLPRPRRTVAAVSLADAKSFVDYYQRYGSDSAVIFANEVSGSIKAVFDYHTDTEADWCDHSATLKLTHSDEYKAWAANNAKTMTQRQFAEFLEDHIKDVVSPPGADLLEIAKTLQANKTLSFSSGTELHNGQVQLKYNEVIQGTAGASGQMEIPREITIGLRVFKGLDAYEIKGRFRYRISPAGELTFSYHLDNIEKVLEDAFDQVLTQIKTGCNGAALFKN